MPDAPREGHGRTALVTGASAGIGAAFARVLASRGYAVVLTARRRDRLEALAAALHREHGVEAHVIVGDLADAATPERITSELAARGLAVDVLINNAGRGAVGSFVESDWQEARAYLQLMVAAPSQLAGRLLSGMVERGWGRIVNVASLAGLLPGSGRYPFYGASKAFLIRFSESLAAAYGPAGVQTCALCPGFTRTEFHDVAHLRDEVDRLPRWMWLDAATVAEYGYAAVMTGRAVAIPGGVNRALALVTRLLPGGLVRLMFSRAERARWKR